MLPFIQLDKTYPTQMTLKKIDVMTRIHVSQQL